MADSGSSAHREPPSPTAQPGAKRRKIRKGTKSCWECKRRKHKCTWSGNEDKCDGCYHRETQCISQEFPEEHVPHVPHERRGVNNANRLQRLEALVEGLYQKLNSGTGTGTGTGTGPGGDRRVWSHKHGDGDGGGDSDGNVDSRSPARISPASAHSHSHVDVVDTNVPVCSLVSCAS
ncbi:hypothetical protein F4808DRAFT_460755 [Astrocystis sublimbata]|nr:hypothetical protein F4808DRAFT_460755 [Astrocystis sublimbata]